MKTESSARHHARLPHRIGVSVRALNATAGSYLLASLASAAVALSVPFPRAEAIIAGGLVSFVVFPVSVIWSFAASTALRASVGVIAPSLVLAATIWLLRGTL